MDKKIALKNKASDKSNEVGNYEKKNKTIGHDSNSVQFKKGECTVCDCPKFIPSSGPGTTCINLNSDGGTCNHYHSEHI